MTRRAIKIVVAVAAVALLLYTAHTADLLGFMRSVHGG